MVEFTAATTISVLTLLKFTSSANVKVVPESVENLVPLLSMGAYLKSGVFAETSPDISAGIITYREICPEDTGMPELL